MDILFLGVLKVLKGWIKNEGFERMDKEWMDIEGIDGRGSVEEMDQGWRVLKSKE